MNNQLLNHLVKQEIKIGIELKDTRDIDKIIELNNKLNTIQEIKRENRGF